MKSFLFTAFFVLFSITSAHGYTQRHTFICKESGEQIDVSSSLLPGGARAISAKGSTIGSMPEVDCSEAAEKFKSPGIGDVCLISKASFYIFNLYGSLGSADAGMLQTQDGFEICIQDRSLSVQ